MSNVMKYIKDLEGVGFQRNQAEAQVQTMMSLIENDVMTKSDFAVFKEQYKNDFNQFQSKIDIKLIELEFRLMTRLGFMFVSSLSVAVAVLAWITKG